MSMENINALIGSNLRRIREDKKLSLDKVAEMTGVSKAALGQIERGESSPTISTVWKIATGLKISFTTLMNEPQSDTVIAAKRDVRPLSEDEGKYRLYPYFPFEDGRRFEVYAVEIEPTGFLQAEAHGEGTQEFITVFDGALTVQIHDQTYTVQNGDSIRFVADTPHAYRNAGETTTRVSMVIYYPE